jgi:hypothetical protein
MFFHIWAGSIKELWINKRLDSSKAHQKNYQALQTYRIQPFERWQELELFDAEARCNISKSILDSYDFYLGNVSGFGSVQGYKAKIQTHEIFVIRASTVGDDGWLEVFDRDGQNIGAARTLLERISWGEIEIIRSYIPTGFPADLK